MLDMMAIATYGARFHGLARNSSTHPVSTTKFPSGDQKEVGASRSGRSSRKNAHLDPVCAVALIIDPSSPEPSTGSFPAKSTYQS
jgi:hypothetical protein